MTDTGRLIRLFADGVEVAKTLRIRIRGCSTMTLLPNNYYVDVYNMDEQEIEYVRKVSNVYAVGEDDETMICFGEVEDIYTRSSDASIVTTIVVSDGKTFWDTVVADSFGGKISIKSAIINLLPSGMLTVYNAEDRQIPRGQTYVGRLSGIISILAKSVNARAYFLNGCVYITSKNKTTQMYSIDDSELIADPEYAEGVLILRTMVKGYSVGNVYNFENNQYRLVTQKINADTLNGLWQCELMLVNELMLDEDGMGGG